MTCVFILKVIPLDEMKNICTAIDFRTYLLPFINLQTEVLETSRRDIPIACTVSIGKFDKAYF